MALTESDAEKLFKVFPDTEFYSSPQAVREVIERHRMFNLLELESGDKQCDFGILTDHPFDTSRFARKRLEEAQLKASKFPTPEDTIPAKLRWARESGEAREAVHRRIADL